MSLRPPKIPVPRGRRPSQAPLSASHARTGGFGFKPDTPGPALDRGCETASAWCSGRLLSQVRCHVCKPHCTEFLGEVVTTRRPLLVRWPKFRFHWFLQTKRSPRVPSLSRSRLFCRSVTGFGSPWRTNGLPWQTQGFPLRCRRSRDRGNVPQGFDCSA